MPGVRASVQVGAAFELFEGVDLLTDVEHGTAILILPLNWMRGGVAWDEDDQSELRDGGGPVFGETAVLLFEIIVGYRGLWMTNCHVLSCLRRRRLSYEG
jgi:hypothetical protein